MKRKTKLSIEGNDHFRFLAGPLCLDREQIFIEKLVLDSWTVCDVFAIRHHG